MPGTNDATNDPARKRRARNTTATRAAMLEGEVALSPRLLHAV